MLAHLIESQIWHLSFSSVSLWGEGSEKQQWPLSTFLSVESCPPALTLMPDISVPPFMPLLPFKLLPWCWSSEGVSLSRESVCGFFKRNCLGLQKFLSSIQSLLVFAARSYGGLSCWHWNTGLGGLVWGWGSSLLRYPYQTFIHHMCIWDQPILHPSPSYQSG